MAQALKRLDAESRDLRDLESRGPWAVVSREELSRPMYIVYVSMFTYTYMYYIHLLFSGCESEARRPPDDVGLCTSGWEEGGRLEGAAGDGVW